MSAVQKTYANGVEIVRIFQVLVNASTTDASLTAEGPSSKVCTTTIKYISAAPIMSGKRINYG